jgi:hypothetical protein
MKTAHELLKDIIESQKQIVEIWSIFTGQYGKGNYDQAVNTLKFLQGYENLI